jgi:hypothetical protein
MLVSQPVSIWLSQFAYPSSHVPITQTPPSQLALACAKLHVNPHAPQLAGSVWKFRGWQLVKTQQPPASRQATRSQTQLPSTQR